MWEFEKHKILMLHEHLGDMVLNFPCVTNEKIYVDRKGIMKLLFKIHEHIFSRWGKEIWFDKWKNNIKDYDTVFIMDGGRGSDAAAYIKKINPKSRVIIYYPNPVEFGDRKAPDQYKGIECEFYSFDKKNAEKLNIAHKGFYYPFADLVVENHKNSGSMSDVFFVGVDKGRMEKLVTLKKRLEALGKVCHFHIVPTAHTVYSSEMQKYLTEEGLSYENVVENIISTKAILEIKQKNQSGMTLRPMEAIFYRKKLITDDADIVNCCFYNPDNILIYSEKTTDEEINKFFSKEYKNLKEEVVQEFNPKNWLNFFYVNAGLC